MKLTIAVALVVAAIPLLAQQPDLSGHWTFNAAQSDNPRDMLQGRDSTGDQSRGGRGGGYPGMGGGRGGFWGHGGGGGVGAEQSLRKRPAVDERLAAYCPLKDTRSASYRAVGC